MNLLTGKHIKSFAKDAVYRYMMLAVENRQTLNNRTVL